MTLTEKQKIQLAEVLKRSRYDKNYFVKAFLGVEMEGKQVEALKLGGRVQFKVAGRRFGKSLITLADLLYECATKVRQKWYITAPSIDQTKIYFNELEEKAGQNGLLSVLLKDKIKWSPFPEVELINGSKIMARSTARDGVYLRGKGANGVAITEAAFIKDKVYQEVIRAMVLDRKGKILAETTPNGSAGYSYQMYQQGLSDQTGYYKSFHATAYDNPRIDKDELERIRREIPDIAFRVEYLAEFVDDDTMVFPWAVLQEVYDDYKPDSKKQENHKYFIGVDLAKYQDYTVIIVLDVTNPPYTIAEYYRYQGRLYSDVVKQVNELQAKYGGRVYLDATGVGDPVAEQIRACEPFVFTARSREELISNLVVQIEQKKLLLPHCWTELRDELRFFQRVRHGQNIKPEAPAGKYDDCVMSLALACWALRRAYAMIDNITLPVLDNTSRWRS